MTQVLNVPPLVPPRVPQVDPRQYIPRPLQANSLGWSKEWNRAWVGSGAS